jgi:hypothetical protein
VPIGRFNLKIAHNGPPFGPTRRAIFASVGSGVQSKTQARTTARHRACANGTRERSKLSELLGFGCIVVRIGAHWMTKRSTWRSDELLKRSDLRTCKHNAVKADAVGTWPI